MSHNQTSPVPSMSQTSSHVYIQNARRWLSYDCVPKTLHLEPHRSVFSENPSGKPVELIANLAFDQRRLLQLLGHRR